jgi:hypothetical protein
MRKLLMASAATLGALLATTGGALAQPVKPVAPGTIVVHLNGYLQFSIGDIGSSYNTDGADKLNPVTSDGDARLYSGFDAETLSGVAYGAQIELRTSTSDAGVAAQNKTGTAGTSGDEAIYVKRAYGYIGTPEAGFVRLGQGDSAFTLMQTGVIEAFGDGAQLNTDGGIFSAVPSSATPGNFIFADASALYATSKVVYLTPVIAGFSGGFGYEPSSNGLKEGYADCANGTTVSSATASVCSSESASNFTADQGKRRKNTIDAAVEYSVKSMGFVTKLSAGYLHGAPIAYDGAPGALGTSDLHYGYDDLSVYEIGGQTTFAGLTLGADVKGGATEDSFAFKPKGARDGLTYIVGATYVLGPYVLGGNFYDGQTSGAYIPGSKTIGKTLEEYGAALGGNYVVGKDLSLFVQYEYGYKHQIGEYLHNKAQFQAIATGATFKW